MIKKISALAVVFAGLSVAMSATAQETTEAELQQIESNRSIYEDKIDISYLSKMVIHPEDDWIGKKVFKHKGACIEVTKELKIKEIKKPFENLYRSANLPDKVEIGVMNADSQVVDCSLYESEITVLE